MKIALIGYGQMGKNIEEIAVQRNHEIVARIDSKNKHEMQQLIKNADVAIEFSVPSQAIANMEKCIENNIPIVCGTTGWNDKLNYISDFCKHHQSKMFYASNFSVGVNLFFKVNAILAEMMNQHPEYGIYTEEIHHTRKKDAPSGTAITLANAILERIERKAQWTLNEANHKEDLVIYAKRIGDVTGTHEIVYDSEIDSITIRHEAKNRKGFAYGAIIAAEWLVNQKNSGTYTMTDML